MRVPGLRLSSGRSRATCAEGLLTGPSAASPASWRLAIGLRLAQPEENPARKRAPAWHRYLQRVSGARAGTLNGPPPGTSKW